MPDLLPRARPFGGEIPGVVKASLVEEYVMLVTDPIADMLARIRNAMLAKHEHVSIPGSRIKRRIAEILRRRAFVSTAVWVEPRVRAPRGVSTSSWKWDGRDPVIDAGPSASPSRAACLRWLERPPEDLHGWGSRSCRPLRVMTNKDAKRASLGGEVLYAVW